VKPTVLLWCGLGVLAILTAVVGCPLLIRAIGPSGEGPGPRAGLGWLHAEHQRATELEARIAASRLRLSFKKETAAEVVAGRLTLREAAARLREADERSPEFNREAFRSLVPGRTDEERYGRQVIRHVEGLLNDRPGEAAEVVARLEAELREYLSSGGETSLPAPPR
jgi:hypothetical protein